MCAISPMKAEWTYLNSVMKRFKIIEICRGVNFPTGLPVKPNKIFLIRYEAHVYINIYYWIVIRSSSVALCHYWEPIQVKVEGYRHSFRTAGRNINNIAKPNSIYFIANTTTTILFSYNYKALTEHKSACYCFCKLVLSLHYITLHITFLSYSG